MAQSYVFLENDKNIKNLSWLKVLACEIKNKQTSIISEKSKFY